MDDNTNEQREKKPNIGTEDTPIHVHDTSDGLAEYLRRCGIPVITVTPEE